MQEICYCKKLCLGSTAMQAVCDCKKLCLGQQCKRFAIAKKLKNKKLGLERKILKFRTKKLCFNPGNHV